MHFFPHKKIIVLPLLIFCCIHFSFSQSASFWKDVPAKTRNQFSVINSTPNQFRSLQLNVDAIRNFLRGAPAYSQTRSRQNAFLLSIPMPDGTFSDFQIHENSVMAPQLAARFPNIKTYEGIGITDAHATIRIDVTVFGFHAMILSPHGQVFIDPVTNESQEFYMSYNKNDLIPQYAFSCGIKNEEDNLQSESNNASPRSIGTELRTYRLALACTGEYARTKGDSVAGALSGMVTSLNRVDGIYEQELDIHMELVANDDKLIFLNGSTDPYTNSDGGAMLDQNQQVIDDSIGNDNYDIGHVFSTGGGGIAGLGVVCDAGLKAWGVTGLSNPVGDAFDVDYVAHEMGHEFGANHSFNSVSGACGGGNRNAFTAYEPGSGSTIMAYAGICAPNDLQQHSDAFFHTANFDEIVNYTQLSDGSSCPVITSTNRKAPEVTVEENYAIPINTPFVLNGSAIDSSIGGLTYSWEEMDKGPACDWNRPIGNAPLFRSFPADTVSYRIFPKMSSIVVNKTVIGEILPSYARTMNFRLTVRDNSSGGGGVIHNDVPVVITVINTGKPFRVTDPDSSGYFQIGTSQLVTWDVASTDSAPINCSMVNILLSLDGGFTYPDTLIKHTLNDGSEMVVIPNDSLLLTKTARVKVAAADNIFFDISNRNFEIGTENHTTGIAGTHDISSHISVFPNPVSNLLTIHVTGISSPKIEIDLYNVMGQLIQKTSTSVNSEEQFSFDMQNNPSGIYFVEVKTEKGNAVMKVTKE